VINKDVVKSSIKLISDLEFTDDDINKIYEIIQSSGNIPSKISSIMDKIRAERRIKSTDDISEIMVALFNSLEFYEFKDLLKEFITNEALIDFIQDLFLEKLI